jgi:hypothetical protein
MTLLHGQAHTSGQTPMPVDRIDDASTVTAVTSETTVWYFVNSGAWAAAAGQAAGTIVNAKLTFTGILNSMKSALGSYNDTSLSFAAATRAATKVSVPEDVFSRMVGLAPADQVTLITPYLATAGDFAIDHRRGQVWLKSKATVANDSASYSYMAPVAGSGGPTASVSLTNLEKAEDAAHTSADKGVMALAVRKDTAAALAGTDGDYIPLIVDADGKLHVNTGLTVDTSTLALETGGNLATIAGNTTSIDGKITACNTGAVVLAAGTAAIGKLAANSGVDIGDVDVTSLPALAAGTNNIGDVDVLTVPSSIQGPGNPVIDSYATIAINLTTGADQVLVASAANKQIWVYGYAFTVGDAAGQTVSLQDEDNAALTGIMEFAQYGGICVPPSGNFAMPVFKLATDKDLEVDITGGDVDGWLAYAIVAV